MAKSSLKKYIELCQDCEGKGDIGTDECVDYHKREYVTNWSTCLTCDGAGRVWITISKTVEPFK